MSISAADQLLINKYAASQGVDPAFLTSIITQESGGNERATSYKQNGDVSAVGIAQILPTTYAQVYPDGTNPPYPGTPELQIAGAAMLLAKYQAAYDNNGVLMATAYNAGPGVANNAQTLWKQQGQDPGALVSSVQQALSMTRFSAQQQAISLAYGPQVTARAIQLGATRVSSVGSDGVAAAAVGGASVADNLANPATALQVSTISDEEIGSVLAETEPQTLVILAGLETQPWFDNRNIVQPKQRTPFNTAPITFQVYFDQPDQPIGIPGKPPLTLNLNCSLSTFRRSMRHVNTKQPTRTGVLVNFWGLEPDTISGSGSTGLFLNRHGITDTISLDTSSDRMRQAAKDGFVEFLALFRQNGIVRFQNPTYSGVTTQWDQLAPDAWSNKFGTSLRQIHGRRNDVAVRGAVVVKFRESVYEGYFTNFDWTEDATKPFAWTFNFSFKVERTRKRVFLPEFV